MEGLRDDYNNKVLLGEDTKDKVTEQLEEIIKIQDLLEDMLDNAVLNAEFSDNSHWELALKIRSRACLLSSSARLLSGKYSGK
jgi:hypothetical protein